MSEHPTREWLILDPNARCYWRDGGQGYSDILGAGLFTTEKADAIVAGGRGDSKVHISDPHVQAALEHARKGLAYFERASSLAPVAPDVRGIVEALGFDPTNHHNALNCPYCNPDRLVLAARDRVAQPSGVQNDEEEEPLARVPVYPYPSSPLPRSTEGEALTALIADWREKAKMGGETGAFGWCADELSALLTARASSPPPPVSSHWQPIETAPKDGQWVMLYVHWQDQRDIIGCGQWTMDGEGRYCWFWPWSNAPTHWATLPVPPSASGPSKERSVPLRQTHYDCGCRIQGGVGVPGCSECTEPGLRS